ncbi:MAG: hypothetical protein ACFE8G_05065 [Candidatus Hermodarchaeota archaeon]
MNEHNLLLKEPRGFAGLIANIMNPLNKNPKFKQAFKNTKRIILINATNLHYAALLTIDKGSLKVEGIRNEPKSNLKKEVTGWNGYIAMDTQIFLGLATKRLSLLKLGVKIVRSKVKMRGIFKLLMLIKLLKILTG